MKSHRNVVAAVALLAVLSAGPAAADWGQPQNDCSPGELSLDDTAVMVQVGFQILQVAL